MRLKTFEIVNDGTVAADLSEVFERLELPNRGILKNKALTPTAYEPCQQLSRIVVWKFQTHHGTQSTNKEE